MFSARLHQNTSRTPRRRGQRPRSGYRRGRTLRCEQLENRRLLASVGGTSWQQASGDDVDMMNDTAVSSELSEPPVFGTQQSGGALDTNSPVAEDDMFVTCMETEITVDVTGNDFDPDGDLDSTSVQITSQAGYGWVPEPTNGNSFVYMPAIGFQGLDEFQYVVHDMQGKVSNQATVRIYVVDRANPYHNPETREDVNGDGVVSPADLLEVLRYQRRRPSSRSDLFLDVNGDRYVNSSDVQAVVDELNRRNSGNCPPVAKDDTFKTSMNTPVTLPVTDNDSDPDDDLLAVTVVVTTSPEHGDLRGPDVNGRIVYMPDAGFQGLDRFRYTVSDAQHNVSIEATVRIYVVNPDCPDCNPVNSNDVNTDGAVSQIDLRIVLSNLGKPLAPQPLLFPEEPLARQRVLFPDANGDGLVSPTDALAVWQALNLPRGEDNGNGHDEQADLGLVLLNWGTTHSDSPTTAISTRRATIASEQQCLQAWWGLPRSSQPGPQRETPRECVMREFARRERRLKVRLASSECDIVSDLAQD